MWGQICLVPRPQYYASVICFGSRGPGRKVWPRQKSEKWDNLGRFPFDQIFRFEIPGIPCDEWNSILRFVGLTNPSRAKIRDQTEDSFTFVYLIWGCSTTLKLNYKRCIRWGWQYHFYRKNLKGVRDYIYGTSLFSWRVQESLSNDERAVHSSGYAHISRSSVFSHYSLKLVRLIHCNNVAVRYFSRLSDRGTVLCLEAWGSAMLNSISRLGETRPEQEWSNGTEFSGYSDFPEF